MRIKLLGVAIDTVTLEEATSVIQSWINKNQQSYVVTPNIEMIMACQGDNDFLEAINSSHLAIPDSARLGWGIQIQQEKNFLKRVIKWPFFLFPTLLTGQKFPITTGTDLMENLIKASRENGLRIGLLGGKKNVAIKLSDRLQAGYPGLKIEFVQENLNVDQNGNHTFFDQQNLIGFKQNQTISDAKEHDFYDNLNSRKLDLLFVAFGHSKQEKWMLKNLKQTNVKVMLGVGGAFDYLSGEVLRAPRWLRGLGFEWLYRLLLQPWRIFRFGSLLQFVFLVLFRK